MPDDFDCVDLWAFAWQEYLKGAQWWLTKTEEELQQKALKLHEDNSFEEILRDEFLFDESWRGQPLTGNDILDFIKVSRSRASSTSLGHALKKLGIDKNYSREYLMPKTRKFINTQN